MNPKDSQRWYQSKKFLAAMVFTVTWVVVLIMALYEMKDTTGYAMTITAMALCLGFIHVLYLGGQTAVDTFLQMALAITGVFKKSAAPKSDTAGSVTKDPETKTDPQIEEDSE